MVTLGSKLRTAVGTKNVRRPKGYAPLRPAARRERRCVPGAATRYAIGPGARNAACVTFATGCYAQRLEFAAVRFACASRFLVCHCPSSLACISTCLMDEARNMDRHGFVALALHARCRVRHSSKRHAARVSTRTKECSAGGTNRDFAIRCASCCHKIGFITERCRLRYRRGRSVLACISHHVARRSA